MNKLNKKQRVACYMRVSTDEQISGYGLPLQEERLRSFISSQDYLLDEKHIFRDEGFSGTLPIEKRPALNALFEAAKNKEFDVLLVYRLDRFGRKILYILDYVQRLDDYGVAFRSVSEPFDTSNAFGRYLLQSLGALAELERETIKERTQGGRKMAAKAGKWVWGPPSYGLKLDAKSKKLNIIKLEAKWTHKFFEWIADEKLSLTEVQKRANELKVPCYSGKKRKKKELKGYWHKKSIARILSNPIYTGTTYFYRFTKGYRGLTSLINKDLQTDEKDWIKFECPQIVSEDLFNRCQAQLQKNREDAKRNIKYDYLFNKLIYCGNCGLKLFAGARLPKNENQKLYRYYHGPRVPKWKQVTVDDNRCKYCCDTGEARFMAVWDSVQGLLESPVYMYEQLRKYTQKSVAKDDIETKLALVEKRLESTIRRTEKLNIVFLDNDSLSYEEYQQRLQDYKRDERALRNQITMLKQQLMSRKERQAGIESIQALHNRLKGKLKNLTYEQKSEIIHLLVNRITLYKKRSEAEVELNIPNFPQIQMPEFSTINSALGDKRVY
ncbi:recombinase family protein [Patescibacteria group bacterium]